MPGFFYDLGRMAGPKVRRAQWTWQSLVGSEEDIIAAEALVGQDLAAEVLRQVEPCKDADLAAAIPAIGEGLAARLTNQKRRFYFHVVELPALNAFALPGGHVFVTRPMLELCQFRTDPTAFVLAHEMAHVVRGHAMDRMMAHSAVRLAGSLAAARTALGSLARQAGVMAVQAVYSQDQESEADRLAVLLMRSAGHDGRAAEQLMITLATATNSLGPGGLGSYFSSHPPFPVRIAAIRRTLQVPA